MTDPDTPVIFTKSRRLYDMTDEQFNLVKAFQTVIRRHESLKYTHLMDCAYCLKKANWNVDEARLLMIERDRNLFRI